MHKMPENLSTLVNFNLLSNTGKILFHFSEKLYINIIVKNIIIFHQKTNKCSELSVVKSDVALTFGYCL